MTRIPAATARRLADPNMTRRARIQTEPEAALTTLMRWEQLPEPRTEWVFHPSRNWRFDFAWPDRLVAVEIEGGVWSGGHDGGPGDHVRGKRFESDAAKYNEAAIIGWLLIRVTPAMIEDGRAVGWIKAALTVRPAR